MTEKYKLSATLVAHEQDVRAIAVLSDDRIVSGSRDCKVILWERIPDAHPPQFTPKKTWQSHSHFVNAVAALPPSAEHPDGLVASGGSDKTIALHDPAGGDEPVAVLLGHTDNVCALAAGGLTDKHPWTLISGSWDGTARVWAGRTCLHVLKPHDAAVWGVCALPDGGFATAAADRQVRLWDASGRLTKAFEADRDCVRDILPVPGVGVATCANSGAVALWTAAGERAGTLQGHESFAYRLALSRDGRELASCGEDRTVRVWSVAARTLEQSVALPCTSVWAVAFLPNGDVAAGGSEGTIRVFSRASSRFAAEADQDALQQAVASHAIAAQTLGPVQKDKLPGPEALATPGTREGQVLMVRAAPPRETVVLAYQWSAATQEWVQVGEVVDAVGSDRKQLFEGREYDHVFEVDVGAGAPLKLPHNASDNPYVSAQQFITRHELPQDHLDQIAKFIIANAGAATLGGSSLVNPWAETSTEVPAFTPVRDFQTFAAGRVGVVVAKMLEFAAGPVGKPFDAATEAALRASADALAAGRPVDSTTLSELVGLVQSWPVEYAFPALDLLRLALARTPELLTAEVLDALVAVLLNTADRRAGLFVLRSLCNGFPSASAQRLLVAAAPRIVPRVCALLSDWPADSQEALAGVTLLLDHAVLGGLDSSLQISHERSAAVRALFGVIETASGPLTELQDQIVYRAVAALGTIASANPGALETDHAAKLRRIASTVKFSAATRALAESVAALPGK